MHVETSYNVLCFVYTGLVVSTCLGAAFVGSLFSGWIADGVGRRRAFQLCALPMIIGASVRYIEYSMQFPFVFVLFYFLFLFFKSCLMLN